MNTNNPTSLTSAEHLKSYVSNGQAITDKVDVVFLSRIVQGFSRVVGDTEKVILKLFCTIHRYYIIFQHMFHKV